MYKEGWPENRTKRVGPARRPKEAHGGPKRPRKAQRQGQRDLERAREAQRRKEGHRSPKRPREGWLVGGWEGWVGGWGGGVGGWMG